MPSNENALGAFLRDRRARLDPAAFGFPLGRRRTPGLRREEVAQRSNISPTWYTWLEQGRGGAPSKDVLERIANGLMLTEPEREHLHFLAFGHAPQSHYKPTAAITPLLQRVLDAMPESPAVIIDATWQVHAWNRAATLILTDYSKLEPERRNILRLVFHQIEETSEPEHWQEIARYLVARFRTDVARAGAETQIADLVRELADFSPTFRELWDEKEVSSLREGTKQLHHEHLGWMEMEYSTFALEGRSDLTLMVHTPATDETALRIKSYLAVHKK